MFDIFNMLKKEEHTAPKQVTRDTIIGDILDMDQTTAPYFMEIGMHCLGCPASRGETIEEACEVHGVNCDELLEKLNTEKALRYERWKEEQKQPSYCDGQELAKLLDTSIAKAGDVIKKLQKARANSSMM